MTDKSKSSTAIIVICLKFAALSVVLVLSILLMDVFRENLPDNATESRPILEPDIESNEQLLALKDSLMHWELFFTIPMQSADSAKSSFPTFSIDYWVDEIEPAIRRHNLTTIQSTSILLLTDERDRMVVFGSKLFLQDFLPASSTRQHDQGDRIIILIGHRVADDDGLERGDQIEMKGNEFELSGTVTSVIPKQMSILDKLILVDIELLNSSISKHGDKSPSRRASISTILTSNNETTGEEKVKTSSENQITAIAIRDNHNENAEVLDIYNFVDKLRILTPHLPNWK